MLGFIAGIVTLLAVLYVPGMLFFSALGFSKEHAFVAAPLYGTMMIGVIPLAYYEFGIECSIISIVGPTLLLAIIVYALSKIGLTCERPKTPIGFLKDSSEASTSEHCTNLSDWKLILIYIICGIIVCAIIFGTNLPTPDAAYIRCDNQSHLNIAKSFLDSGKWSSLHPNFYLDLDSSTRPILSKGSSFYPSSLSALSALVALMANLEISAAFNAVLFTLCAVVFPVGMFAIMRVIFGSNRKVIALGAIATVAFTAFPWGLFVRAAFPNVVGYCLMAPAIGSTMIFISQKMRLGIIMRGFILWICALPALALAHPNAVFTAFVFLVFFTAHIACKNFASAAEMAGNNILCARFMGLTAVLVAALVLWIICLNLPPLASVLSFYGNTPQTPIHIAGCLLLLKCDPFGCQYALALLVIIGVISCIRKRCFWLLAPALYMAVAYFIVRLSNSPLAHILAGFWYCDHIRIAAALNIFYVPFVALGISAITNAITRLVLKKKQPESDTPQHALISITIVVICVCLFFPGSTTKSNNPLLNAGFGSVYQEVHNMYRESDKHVYGSDEQTFVDRAVELTGSDLVLNYPADGSTFAYPLNNMKVYYRAFKIKSQTDAAKIIRLNLNKYASDDNVRDAVRSTGAHWLLKLDQGVSFEDGNWMRQYTKPERFAGIENVDDQTPGFTAVLSEGDMRLYRIDDLA